jgi:uncharacterized SAM-dependent methyltransferase
VTRFVTSQDELRQFLRGAPQDHLGMRRTRAVQQGLGDAENGVRPTLFIHSRCRRLIETLPTLQHYPSRSEDVLKVDADEDGVGGDDAADCCRYLVHRTIREGRQRKLLGL